MTKPAYVQKAAIVGKGWRLWHLAVTYGTKAPLDVVAIQYDGRDEWEILVAGDKRKTLRAPSDLSMGRLVERLHDEGHLEGGLFAFREGR